MANSISIWFKGLSEGWRTATILGGFVICVATTAIAIDHFKTKVKDASSVIDYLTKENISRIKNEHKKDSIETKRHEQINIHFATLFDRLKKDSIAREIFQNNYSLLIWNKFGNEWRKYMNGMQVTVIQDSYLPTKSLEEKKPSFKIHIERDTTKRK